MNQTHQSIKKIASDQSVQQSQISDTSIYKQRNNSNFDKKADNTPDGTKNGNNDKSKKNTWFEMTKLLKSSLIYGKRHYLVQWTERTKNRTIVNIKFYPND